MPQKSLNCSEEDFFLMVQLVCGPPRPQHFAHQGSTRWDVGIQAWCLNTDEGRRFTQCVTNCGEAKVRAGRMYSAYAAWWRKQHNVSWEQWRKEINR